MYYKQNYWLKTWLGLWNIFNSHLNTVIKVFFKKYFTWSAWISIINAFLLQLASFSFTRKSCISSGASGIRCSKFLEIKQVISIFNKSYFVILVTLWTLPKLTFIKPYNTIHFFAFQNFKSIRKFWVWIRSLHLHLLSYQIICFLS